MYSLPTDESISLEAFIKICKERNLMQRNDFALIKQQMAVEILKENDDLDKRYLDRNPLHIISTIGDGITNPALSEDQLREQIKRCLEVDYNRVIAAQHFSQASCECIEAFRSRMFLACVMMTHSVNEGIIDFVVSRNKVNQNRKLPTKLETLVSLNLITSTCAQASEAIWKSYRNDIHHMNPGISKIKDWHGLAKQNLRHLATVEYCVFGYNINRGAMDLHYPQHWDITDDGKAEAYVRLVVSTN